MTMTTGLTEGTLKLVEAINYANSGDASPIIVPDTDRKDLADLFAAYDYTRGAEVGVESGRYSFELLTRIPGLHLYCVDAWMPYKGYREHVTNTKLEGLYADARDRLRGKNVTFVRNWSVDAAREFADGSLDFVYIDANHDYKHVIEDLEAWVPKVRRGGMVAGHDYCGGRQRSGYVVEVVQAVKDFTKQHRIAPWFVVGAPELVPGTSRERPRDFVWIKE